MATGDSADFLARLRGVIPKKWFGFTASRRDAVLGAISDSLSGVFSLLEAVRAQTRLLTSGGWLIDLFAYDFFGLNLPRFGTESDAVYKARVQKELARERVTEAGIKQAILDLTGTEPKVFRPYSAADCGGGYGVGAQGYGVSGAYGSLSYPNQIFLTVTRPPLVGQIPNVPGYGVGNWGYGSPNGEYASLSMVQGPIQDSDIYATISNSTAAGVVAWTHLIK